MLPYAGRGTFKPALTLSTSRALSAFPPRLRRTLRYVQTGSKDVANFGLGTQIFRANSLYDPDFSGTGHQPNGYDTLLAAYNHYTVVRARITVTLRAPNTGSGLFEPGVFVLAFSSTGTFLGSQTLESALEKKTTLCYGPYGPVTGLQSANCYEGMLNIPALLGKTEREVVEMSNLRGSLNASPAETYYFELGFFSESSNPGAITWNAILEFDTVFTEPVSEFGDS